MLGLGAMIGTGINAIGSIAQIITGAKQTSDARKAINNYKRQKLENVGDSISIATMAADAQTEEVIRGTASSVGALREGGARTLVSGMGQVNDWRMKKMLEITSGLEKQEVARDYFKAEDKATIRGMQERREEKDLEGLANELAVGQQNQFNGLGNLAQSASSGLNLMGQAGMLGMGKSSNPFTNMEGADPNPFV